MSIRIDPDTGLKIFATRAAKATDKIAGKGYSILDDDSLTTRRPLEPREDLLRIADGCREPDSLDVVLARGDEALDD